MAQQVYAASLMVIELDSEVEREYLRMLFNELKLDVQIVNEIHQQLKHLHFKSQSDDCIQLHQKRC